MLHDDFLYGGPQKRPGGNTPPHGVVSDGVPRQTDKQSFPWSHPQPCRHLHPTLPVSSACSYVLDCAIIFLLGGAFLGQCDACPPGFPESINIIRCSSHFGLLGIQIDAFCFGIPFLASSLHPSGFRSLRLFPHKVTKLTFKCLYHFIYITSKIWSTILTGQKMRENDILYPSPS